MLADGTICGGYRKTPFTHSGGAFLVDPDAFLFRLRLKGSLSVLRSTGQKDTKSVFDHPAYHPTFGAGNDLQLDPCGGRHNVKTFQFADQNYPLTGGLQDLSTPGPLSVQVYAVKVDQDTRVKVDQVSAPWASEPIFTAENVEELRADLRTAEDAWPPNLLLFGPVGAGKSSLARSILSALAGRMVGGITVGTGEGTVTKQLKKYPLQLDGKTLAWLWDTAGVEDKLYSGGEFNYLLQGNLSHGTDLAQTGVNDRTAGFNPTPREEERVDCVLMCVSASQVSDKDTMKRMQLFNGAIRQRDVASMLVITKVT